MKLNASQAAVAATRERRVLVLAGAGTGKTATSVHWVAGLVRQGVARSSVLMITFTRKAAAEMARRVEGLVASVPRRGPEDQLTVGTYHAVALVILRKEGKAYGFASNAFTTIDESECHSIWKSALKQCGFAAQSKIFVPSRLHALYSLARNMCRPPEEVFAGHFGEGSTGEAMRVARAYDELKRAANVADYDDLLVLWRDRMEREPEFAARLRARWRYVLVDEMQDNNQLNQALLDLLDPAHLMVVGDANQSIYGFRGSDVSLIMNFRARNPDAKLLRLEDNYRSGQGILDLANQVVARTEAALVLRSHNGAAARLEFLCYPNSTQEASGVIGWLRERIGSGKRPQESAILARGSKTLTALEVLLNQERIRYKKYGGLTLADAAEIKDFLAFLRVAHNPHDKIALLRALTQFPGIGEGTAARTIAEHEGGLFGNLHWPRPAEEMLEWVRAIRELGKPGPQGRFLLEKIKPVIEQNYPKDAPERLSTIESLVASMEQIESSLGDFLDGFTLSRQSRDEHPHDAVVLSTIHSAKGLEWDGVWVLGAGSAQMPHPRAEDAAGIEEERRLFYVAVTRAKHDLVVSYPQMTDRRQAQTPSPFAPETSEWKTVLGMVPRLEVAGEGPEVEGPLVSLFRQITAAQGVAGGEADRPISGL